MEKVLGKPLERASSDLAVDQLKDLQKYKENKTTKKEFLNESTPMWKLILNQFRVRFILFIFLTVYSLSNPSVTPYVIVSSLVVKILVRTRSNKIIPGERLSWVVLVVCIWWVKKSMMEGIVYYFLFTGFSESLVMADTLWIRKAEDIEITESLGYENVIGLKNTNGLISKVNVFESTSEKLNEFEVFENNDGLEITLDGLRQATPALKANIIHTIACVSLLCDDTRVIYNTTTKSYQALNDPLDPAIRSLLEELESIQYSTDISEKDRAQDFQIIIVNHQGSLSLWLIGANKQISILDSSQLTSLGSFIPHPSFTQLKTSSIKLMINPESPHRFEILIERLERSRSWVDNKRLLKRYLTSSGLGEMVAMVGLGFRFDPTWFVWVNLLTDDIPAHAIGLNKPGPDVMERQAIGWSLRWVVLGLYIGFATIFGYVWWYVFYENGPQISFYQLYHFKKCSQDFPDIGCDMFTNELSLKAATVSLSILFLLKLLNILNSMSDTISQARLPPSTNPYLVLAIVFSGGLYYMVLNTPILAKAFGVISLNEEEWTYVTNISVPIVLIDEFFKYVTKTYISPVNNSKSLQNKTKKQKEN